MKKNSFILILLVLLSIPSLLPLFNAGLFVSDDASWMVIRFSAFYEAFRDGQFPVRFLSRLNFGYGYPVANFLYPGFMYLATPVHLLGFNFQESIKIILGFSMVMSGIFSYLWLSKLFNKTAGFFGALFYLYSPYHLFDLYRRGSVGEVLALAIVPFILWQTERKSIFFTSLAIFFLLISHNTLAAIFLPIIILNFLIDVYASSERKKIAIIHGISLTLGILMSSFFSVPALIELKNTVFSGTKISNYEEYFANISLIGSTTLIIYLIFIIFLFSKKVVVEKHRLTLCFFLIGILALFFSTEFSLSFWRILPVSFIQFPFRLLSVVILSASFLVAFLISRLTHKNSIIGGTLFILVTLFFSKDFLVSTANTKTDDSIYSTNEATTTVMDEYMPTWVKEKPTSHFSQLISSNNPATQISDIFFNSNFIKFDYISEGETTISINRIYYPGWKVRVNSKEKNINYDNELGIMEILVPAGKGNVVLNFSETNIRLLADFISLISFVFLVLISIKPRLIFKK